MIQEICEVCGKEFAKPDKSKDKSCFRCYQESLPEPHRAYKKLVQINKEKERDAIKQMVEKGIWIKEVIIG